MDFYKFKSLYFNFFKLKITRYKITIIYLLTNLLVFLIFFYVSQVSLSSAFLFFKA